MTSTAHRISTRAGIDVLTWSMFDDLPVQAVVTTRSGGVSEGPYTSLNLGLHVGDDPARVLENRARAAATIGLDRDDLVFCNQAHGRVVVGVDATMAGLGADDMDSAVAGADALVTEEKGVGLVVMVADCVPILLVDPVGRRIACVHAGWRGTVADVVGATVQHMVDAGTDAADLYAGIGPAIPPDRYQVGGEVRDAVVRMFPQDHEDVIGPDDEGRWRMDLWTANARLLRRAGVPDDRVALSDVPTGPDTRFFSDRAVRPCGRFALLATLD